MTAIPARAIAAVRAGAAVHNSAGAAAPWLDADFGDGGLQAVARIGWHRLRSRLARSAIDRALDERSASR